MNLRSVKANPHLATLLPPIDEVRLYRHRLDADCMVEGRVRTIATAKVKGY